MSARHRSTAHRRKAVVSLVALLAGIAAVVGLQVPGAYGGFIAKVGNTNDTATAATYFTCGNAALGESGTKAYFAYPFGETSGTTATDASGNNRPGTYSNVTLGTPNTTVCPRDGKSVVTLNGTNSYIVGPAASAAAPNVFSEEIWFRTGSAQGKLIGFGSSNGGFGSLTSDRHLYIDANGRLEFGVGAGTTVVGPATVTDNVWHHAVGTLSGAGMALYLDGVLVGSNTAVTTGTTYLTGGYWRIGYDSLLLWPNAPASNYFKGNLAFAAVYGYALSATQVAAHYAAGR